jgi:hypothetical protein
VPVLTGSPLSFSIRDLDFAYRQLSKLANSFDSSSPLQLASLPLGSRRYLTGTEQPVRRLAPPTRLRALQSGDPLEYLQDN